MERLPVEKGVVDGGHYAHVEEDGEPNTPPNSVGAKADRRPAVRYRTPTAREGGAQQPNCE